MFSSRAFPRLSRLLRSSRAFSAALPQQKAPYEAWRLPGVYGLLAGGALMLAWSRPTQSASPVGDVLVGKVTDLAEGVPRQVQVGSDPANYIVVAKVAGQVFAVSGKCAHLGASLADGFLDGYHFFWAESWRNTLCNKGSCRAKTRFCPWHSAAFDIRSGEIFGGPTVDSLNSYRARIAPNGDVLVSIPESHLSKVSEGRPSPHLVKPDGSDSRTFVIVGGNAAGHSCSESLRRNGFRGKIVLLSEDSVLPYDSTRVSTLVKEDISTVTLRPAEFYTEYGIEVRLGTAVKAVDAKSKTVKTVDGGEIKYDKLCIASGSKGRVTGLLAAAARNVRGVYTLRSSEQFKALRTDLEKARNVVIVGASLLGLELATALRHKYPTLNVTLIDEDNRPLADSLGGDISRQLLDLQHRNGVNTILGQHVSAINETDGRVRSVTVDMRSEFKAMQQEERPADIVFVATQSVSNTDFVPHSLLNQDRTVKVDAFLRSDDPHIYAAGDVASYHSVLSQTSQSVDYLSAAQDQGRTAAENMLGFGQPFNTVPFLYSTQFSKVLVAGYTTGADWTWTETESEDEPEKTARITYFYKGERCIGVSTINKAGAVQRLRVALMRNLMPSRSELSSGRVKFAQIAATVEATQGGKWGPRRRRCEQRTGPGCSHGCGHCQAKK